MIQDSFSIILVPSTNHAMRAENILKKANVSCKLIPVPRQISSDCGVCIRIQTNEKQSVLKILKSSNLDIEGIHDL